MDNLKSTFLYQLNAPIIIQKEIERKEKQGKRNRATRWQINLENSVGERTTNLQQQKII